MELNYTNTPVGAPEPKATVPTVVQMTEELGKRVYVLRDAASAVAEAAIGGKIDLPNGGDGPLSNRVFWVLDSLRAITDALERTSEFLR